MNKFYKVLRMCLFIVLTVLGGIAMCGLSPMPQPKAKNEYKIPIIMYHSTYSKGAGKYTVTPALLEKDILYIKEKGYTPIFMKDLINFKEYGAPLPDKPIMITIDDGYYNNYTNAFPLFKKHKVKCIMSVVGKYIDDNYKDGELCPKGSSVTYEQVEEMHKSGLVEIQCHSYNMHHAKGRLGMRKRKGETVEEYRKALTNDLTRLQKNLKERANITCDTVCYPFGEYSKESEAILRELGYKAALTCNEGINVITRNSNLFYLKRYNRPYGRSSGEFFKRIEDKMK